METNLKVYIGNLIAVIFNLTDLHTLAAIVLALLTSVYTIFKIVESYDKRKWYKEHKPKRPRKKKNNNKK